jgi:hypothetical protein
MAQTECHSQLRKAIADHAGPKRVNRGLDAYFVDSIFENIFSIGTSSRHATYSTDRIRMNKNGESATRHLRSSHRDS